MAHVITRQDLHDDTESILDAVATGTRFIVEDDGVPVAELCPIQRPVFVDKQELRRAAVRLPPIDGTALRTELDELYDQEPFRDA